jgi:glycogen synthase
MHIAQITLRYAPALGGVEYQVLNLANELNKKGHKITVYTSYFLDDMKEEPHYCHLKKEKITVIPLGVSDMDNLP